MTHPEVKSTFCFVVSAFISEILSLELKVLKIFRDFEVFSVEKKRIWQRK